MTSVARSARSTVDHVPVARSRRRLAGTMALLALCSALAACSSDTDTGVASLDGTPEGGSPGAEGADVAGDFAACLRDNGVADVTLEDGEVGVGGPGGTTTTSVDESGVTSIEVNGVDISEPWNTCLQEVPAYEDILTAASEEYSAANEEGALEWVQCARDNGFTQFADPTDGVLMIPDGLTAAQAEAVVEACPLEGVGAIGASGEVADGVLDAFSSVLEAYSSSRDES